MTLALHPTNALAYYWAINPGWLTTTPPKKTCSVCRYELIADWCSRCDLEENGVLV